MRYTNTRYSTTLNDAQLDYLSDECQDISRMMCFKTFLRMAAIEPFKVTRKNFSADLQTGQFIASKVELAMLWKCNRKTATRIIREFNQMGILRSEASNRTTVHTLLCLSVWFTEHGMVRNRFFVSNPIVKLIEKPTKSVIDVPPEKVSETAETDKAVSADSDVTPVLGNMGKEESGNPLISHADGTNEPIPIHSSFSLPSTCSAPQEGSAICLANDMNLLTDNAQKETTEAVEVDARQAPCNHRQELLREDTTKGKENGAKSEDNET